MHRDVQVPREHMEVRSGLALRQFHGSFHKHDRRFANHSTINCFSQFFFGPNSEVFDDLKQDPFRTQFQFNATDQYADTLCCDNLSRMGVDRIHTLWGQLGDDWTG